MKPNWEKEEESGVVVEETTKLEAKPRTTPVLMLYNDDYNIFPHVIECLVKYCEHAEEQAHQIAMIVHTKGKCDIKHGSYDDLRPIYEALQENHLSVKIEI